MINQLRLQKNCNSQELQFFLICFLHKRYAFEAKNCKN